MPGIPAYVVDAAYNVLAWNRLATHFIGDLSRYEDRNMIRWTFLRAPQEVVWSDADFVRFTRSTVADLRAAARLGPARRFAMPMRHLCS
jgi:MmyB-like transcription regulator ligand binding domain